MASTSIGRVDNIISSSRNGNIQTIELNNSALQRKSESRPDVLATRSSRVISNTQNIFCGRRLHRPFLGTIKLWRLRPMTMHSYISGVLKIFGIWRDIDTLKHQ